MASKKIHVVFGEFAKETLLSSNKMKGLTDSVVSLNDDLRVGPIAGLSQLKSRSERQNWLKNNTPCQEDGEYLSTHVGSDFDKIQSLKDGLDNDSEIFIWCGRTTFDRLSTARLVFELQNSFNRLTITDIPNVKIRSKFGHDYIPECLGVMNPEEVHLIEKYLRKINEEECNEWMNLWIRLANNSGLLRVSETVGLIESKDEVHFDKVLLSKCTEDFLEASKVVGESLVDIRFEASDITLNWRLVHLAKSKKLDFEGKLNCLREYKVKRSTTKPELH